MVEILFTRFQIISRGYLEWIFVHGKLQDNLAVYIDAGCLEHDSQALLIACFVWLAGVGMMARRVQDRALHI